MRATVMYAAGDVRVQDVPDPAIVEPTDAILGVTRACICGSDLHPYHQMKRSETGTRMGHAGRRRRRGRRVGRQQD